VLHSDDLPENFLVRGVYFGESLVVATAAAVRYLDVDLGFRSFCFGITQFGNECGLASPPAPCFG
jgi:hypothetical protein